MRRRVKADDERATVQLGLRLTERERRVVERLVTALPARSAAEVIKKAIVELEESFEREQRSSRASQEATDGQAGGESPEYFEIVTNLDSDGAWRAVLRHVRVASRSAPASSPEAAISELRNRLAHYSTQPTLTVGGEWSAITRAIDRLGDTRRWQPPPRVAAIEKPRVAADRGQDPPGWGGELERLRLPAEEAECASRLWSLEAQRIALRVAEEIGGGHDSELLPYLSAGRCISPMTTDKRLAEETDGSLVARLERLVCFAMNGGDSIAGEQMVERLFPVLRKYFRSDALELGELADELILDREDDDFALVVVTAWVRLSVRHRIPIRVGALCDLTGLSPQLLCRKLPVSMEETTDETRAQVVPADDAAELLAALEIPGFERRNPTSSRAVARDGSGGHQESLVEQQGE